MVALKRFVTVVVMVYLLLFLLFLLVPSVRASVAGLGDALSDAERERNFFYTLSIIGALVLAVQLVVENLDSSLLRRSVARQDGKINELKAKLYDGQQTGLPVTSRPADRYIAPAPSAAAGSEHPLFPQSDPSLSNTPPAERPPL